MSVRETLSVIIPTHDRPAALVRCVRSLRSQTRLPDEMVIINDGGMGIRPEIAEMWHDSPAALIVERRDVPSSAGSRNRGLELACGNVVLLLDDDAELPVDALYRLLNLYESDTQGDVAGIGLTVVDPDADRLARRVWEYLAGALGRARWGPRRIVSRYITLPHALRKRLVPARKLSGTAMSLRAHIARSARFCEHLGPYAYGEDRDLSFRLAPGAALFLAPDIRVLHHREPGVRGEMHERGRQYVANSLHIARYAAESGAGTVLLLGYDLAGTILMYSLWGLAGRNRNNLRFAAGVIHECAQRLVCRLRGMLCG